MAELRTDWTKEEISDLYHSPLMDLIYRAATVHREHHDTGEVQVCTLLSIKTGGCPEDCAYCPQSARYNTDVEPGKMLDSEEILGAAQKAKEAGSTRFCMGAAWRNARKTKDFDKVLDMVREITDMDMEVCCTLGMLTDEQAAKLKEAGLYAYNHNLDTSEDFYNRIISTRSYEDRLETLETVRNNNISVCCGGIVGMGETDEDRIELIHNLSTMPQHPESVPINALIAVEGTPMENQPKVPWYDMARMIATARITMPDSMVRLSAGRVNMSMEEQAHCFMAGANSIFTGEKLLTTENNELEEDKRMFEILGLTPREAFKNAKKEHVPEKVEAAE
ncbi:biotin synthase BioB [Balneolaceae bacterium YR4-1]|uniref:Biotin synthase n=1 Tax=Halalkalibaculum roseum TaxID=2709311 RepID=A0A6M1T7M6_9BACT|nr:biotin synthase BioB [Halalkalibaculum roseum]NGP76263.1 biotin synthase BioB [Halalkalibaculum roseum]